MGNRFEPHILRGCSGERGAPAAGAEEDETLVLRKDWLVVWALGVDPELQHATRAMEGAGDAALALQFARITQIHKNDVVPPVHCHGFAWVKSLDFCIGLVQQRLVTARDCLGHGGSHSD